MIEFQRKPGPWSCTLVPLPHVKVGDAVMMHSYGYRIPCRVACVSCQRITITILDGEKRLQFSRRTGREIGRPGGDRFVVCTSEAEAHRLAQCQASQAERTAVASWLREASPCPTDEWLRAASRKINSLLD